MTEPTPELEKLLRLKRHERPPQGYFDNFLHEFHQRQRAELATVSSFALFADRVAARFYEFRFLLQPRWAYGVGAAYAVLMISLFFRQAKPTSSEELTKAREHASAPATATAPLKVVNVLRLAPGGGGAVRPPGEVPVSMDSRVDGATLPNGLRRTSSDVLPPLVPLAQPERATSRSSTSGGQVIILVR